MTVVLADHPLQRSADDFGAMYERVRCRAPTLEGAGKSLGHAPPGHATDVTDTPWSSPRPRQTPGPHYQFDDLLDEPDYDQLSDFEYPEESRLIHTSDAETVRKRAMAADFSEGRLETFVGSPQKELAGTQNQYVSYQVTTKSDFQSFQKPEFSVRRRFTDFVFLWKQLSKEYPQCAVPPLPDKHKMEYVRGDRFGPDFTQRRAHSLHRFLKRIALHPVLRRAALVINFLESPDWNQHMKGRSSRATSASEQGNSGFVDAIADTFVNTFTKIHKPDQRFIEVSERANKLSEDLNNVEKVTVKVARRQGDLETDYADLATQCQKLTTMEPAVQGNLTSFAASVNTTSQGFKSIRDHTDQNYLTSLRDMDAYIQAVKTLLRTREGKQLDFEQLSEYLAKSAADRDSLASATGAGMGASGFLRSKVEDFRGIDHDQARRQRVRKLEVEIERLTGEVELSKKASEAFDEHTVKEVADFERIKAIEFKDTLGDLADAHVDFFQGTIETWEKFLEDMRKEEDQRKAVAVS